VESLEMGEKAEKGVLVPEQALSGLEEKRNKSTERRDATAAARRARTAVWTTFHCQA
jgi:hypothetical protein